MLISTYLKSYYLENSVIVKSVQLFFSYKCLLESLSKLTLRFGIYCIGIMLSSIIMSGVLTTRSVWYLRFQFLLFVLNSNDFAPKRIFNLSVHQMNVIFPPQYIMPNMAFYHSINEPIVKSTNLLYRTLNTLGFARFLKHLQSKHRM
jgi:hypothetical protein